MSVTCVLLEFFFEIYKLGIIDIFVLLKIENKGEIVIGDIIFNSCVLDKAKLLLELNWLTTFWKKFIYIKSFTETPILPTSGISKNVDV